MEPPLQTIALAPDGGIFADLIGIALSEHGYTIIDTGATAALLVLMRKNMDDLLSPQALGMLKERGIEALLIVTKIDGKDGLPQTVHVRLYSTDHTAEVGGIDWKNSWIRRGAWEAVEEIAAAMVQTLRWQVACRTLLTLPLDRGGEKSPGVLRSHYPGTYVLAERGSG
jgi:hypothetical protein